MLSSDCNVREKTNKKSLSHQAWLTGLPWITDGIPMLAVLLLQSSIACRHLQKLESLEICGGRLTDAGVAILSTIPSLRSISLAHNVGITDNALPMLARLTNLSSLNMTHCKITGAGLTALYGLTV